MSFADRSGTCVCGVPVIRHFDADNRKLSCEQAKVLRMDAVIARWQPVAKVASASGAGEYEIRKDPNSGTLGCTCKGWQFRQSCKHVDMHAEMVQAAKAMGQA